MDFSWDAPEYIYVEKSSDWFWAFGIIAVAASVAAIIMENILFGLLILIGAFVLSIFAARKPKTIHFEINDKGVVIDKTIYPFRNIESFNTTEEVLLIKTNKKLTQLLVIPLEVNSEEVHDFLLQHIEEEVDLEIPLIQTLMEALGL